MTKETLGDLKLHKFLLNDGTGRYAVLYTRAISAFSLILEEINNEISREMSEMASPDFNQGLSASADIIRKVKESIK